MSKKNISPQSPAPPPVQTAPIFVGVPVSEWNELKSVVYRVLDKIERFTPNTEEYMTVEEVCKLMRIGRTTLYKLINNREIPATKVRGKVRFRATDVKTYFEKNNC